MKNGIILLLALMVTAGCATKVEKAQENIARTWRISKVYQNEDDVTESYTESREEYRLTFKTNGTFTESYRPFSGADVLNVSGTWVFSDGINKITLTTSSQSRVYQIDALSATNLHITDLGSSNKLEILFVPL